MHRHRVLELLKSDQIVCRGQATAAATTMASSWRRSTAPLKLADPHTAQLTRALPGLQRVRQAQNGRMQQQLEALTHPMVATEWAVRLDQAVDVGKVPSTTLYSIPRLVYCDKVVSPDLLVTCL